MPELPEVETTRRGIRPHIENSRLNAIRVHQRSLRWPVPPVIEELQGHRVSDVKRRGKYLLLEVQQAGNETPEKSHAGNIIIHLGMSGSLRICSSGMPLRKHDHAEFEFGNDTILRFHDPRRFGCILWQSGLAIEHALLKKLGPEPLDDAFDGEHLFALSRKRKVSVKNFIMDSHVVVGVGNIYASESLFCAGLRPGRSAARVTRAQYALLAMHIKRILANAIEVGGTTLRDFVNSDGAPGYFAQQLLVYGREGEPCRTCDNLVKNKIIGQRSSFYCPNCQT